LLTGYIRFHARADAAATSRQGAALVRVSWDGGVAERQLTLGRVDTFWAPVVPIHHFFPYANNTNVHTIVVSTNMGVGTMTGAAAYTDADNATEYPILESRLTVTEFY
jgi:hypothetical protein